MHYTWFACHERQLRFAGWLTECTASHSAQNNTLWSILSTKYPSYCVVCSYIHFAACSLSTNLQTSQRDMGGWENSTQTLHCGIREGSRAVKVAAISCSKTTYQPPTNRILQILHYCQDNLLLLASMLYTACITAVPCRWSSLRMSWKKRS
jgi:hypothetical protein